MYYLKEGGGLKMVKDLLMLSEVYRAQMRRVQASKVDLRAQGQRTETTSTIVLADGLTVRPINYHYTVSSPK